MFSNKISVIGLVLGICLIVVSGYAYSQISTLQRDNESATVSNGQLQTQVNGLNAQLTATQNQLTAIQNELAAAEAQIASLTQESTNMQIMLAQKNAILEAMEQQAFDLVKSQIHYTLQPV